MVHMSSHIYIRSGYYAEGVRVNEKAIDAYEKYKKIFPDVQRYISIYYAHNVAMGFANALFLPNYETAIKFARMKRSSITNTKNLNDGLSNSEQYSYAVPYLAWVRYGKWDLILSEPVVPKHLVYAGLLQHFARGLAFARRNQSTEASNELKAMTEVINHPELQIHPIGENAPVAGSRVALSILKGIIAQEKGNFNDAITAFQQAVANEDSMDYNEPKDWLLPARQYLGEVFLSQGSYSKAEYIFKEDLKLNPKNVWSLTGLFHALPKQHRTKESKSVYKQLQPALAGKDLTIEHAVF
jgi:tetratricopeptide (TPR) repeat protein